MTTDIFKRLLIMIVLVLLQALVLNHIHLFYCATPMLYLILPLHFGNLQARWSALLWCFCTGLLVDIFSNTPGVAAGSLTFIGLLQPYVLTLFAPKDEEEETVPSVKTLGWLKFFSYAFVLVFIYCFFFFTFESFSFFNLMIWAESIGGSTLLTLFIIMALEKINK